MCSYVKIVIHARYDRTHGCTVSFFPLHPWRSSFALKTIFTLCKTGTSAVTRFHGERLSPILYRERCTV